MNLNLLTEEGINEISTTMNNPEFNNKNMIVQKKKQQKDEKQTVREILSHFQRQ